MGTAGWGSEWVFAAPAKSCAAWRRPVDREHRRTGKEGHMKTICALVFVTSVLYILLILLKFT
ncbi:MAG: hypothetical protein CVU57_20795 [Deltaproteobacteria bacterium HGW-Deltaproteobacteria-15]|jgi:hypothetical protein|nr:MAG: hypothetical protein CVU57_20795 [Deltaproteobacteria bacterium HGW-Deltaproteobacteria-15]